MINNNFQEQNNKEFIINENVENKNDKGMIIVIKNKY